MMILLLDWWSRVIDVTTSEREFQIAQVEQLLNMKEAEFEKKQQQFEATMKEKLKELESLKGLAVDI